LAARGEALLAAFAAPIPRAPTGPTAAGVDQSADAARPRAAV